MVKEYTRSGKCEIHTETSLVHRFDGYDEWFQCPTCTKEDEILFHKKLEEIAKRVIVRPLSKGGDGSGITCPCCSGNGYVTKQYADEVEPLLKDLTNHPYKI